MKTVYIETSVVSYLTSKPSRDLIVAAHQQITQEWWENVLLQNFEPCISEVVIEEAGQGDPSAAERRLSKLVGIHIIPTTSETKELATAYLHCLSLPQSAGLDAAHLAIAVLNDVDYLVSWNCKHIANGRVIRLIQEENKNRGLKTPVICTPEELWEA
jgi:hypothetical protein